MNRYADVEASDNAFDFLKRIDIDTQKPDVHHFRARDPRDWQMGPPRIEVFIEPAISKTASEEPTSPEECKHEVGHRTLVIWTSITSTVRLGTVKTMSKELYLQSYFNP